MIGLAPGAPAARAETLLARRRAAAIFADRGAAEAERLVDHRYPDGSKMMTVDLYEDGYLLDAPGHGAFMIALDGATVECAPAPGPAWRWHRPLFAQALPLAAALRGVEVLHASAVVLGDGAVAFVGSSGAGKTSLAVNLVDQGAPLLTDDVLALTATGPAVFAHPGARFANVAPEQIAGLADSERLGQPIGRSEKLHLFVTAMSPAAVPLRALCFLERHDGVAELELERIPEPGPDLLLAATFLAHVRTPARLVAQLDVCSLIASTVATFHLRVPAGVGAAELAVAVPSSWTREGRPAEGGLRAQIPLGPIRDRRRTRCSDCL